MSDTAIGIMSVWKKFRRGERYDSLRDLIPAMTRRLFRVSQRGGLGRREFWALQDVSFAVQRGEALGIIGPNGAGKSTLLKLLSGILWPDKGHVQVKGRLSALIETGAGFHPDLTGRENIYLNGAILGMSKAELARKFDEIVEFSGLADFIDTPVKRYSSGMYARLGFAVAAHVDPEVMLVDEVLAVGDAAFQRRCLGRMDDVSKGGRTVLFVSHNMAAIKQLCPRALWLDKGRIRADGPSHAVVNEYLTAVSGRSEGGVIPPEAHRGGSGGVRIRQVEIRNSSGRSVNDLLMDERFEIVVRFEALKPITAASMGVGICTLEGTRIAALEQVADGAPPITVEPGCYEIGVGLVNFLLPGNYSLDIGVRHTLEGEALDYVLHATTFTVLDVSAEADSWVPFNGNYRRGVIQVDAKWGSLRCVPTAVGIAGHPTRGLP